MLEEGSRAPDMTLTDQHGAPRALSELWSKGPVVLYFYPKDETLGCTAEACAFRDRYESFREAGAEVVGVSTDSTESHASFASHHRLPFVLLTDKGGLLAKAYAVKPVLGLIKGRVTYVIDTEGVVRMAFNSAIRPTAHIGEALEAVSRLASPRS